MTIFNKPMPSNRLYPYSNIDCSYQLYILSKKPVQERTKNLNNALKKLFH